MADAYRYPLTRICLRTGSLTLPLSLLGVFPERGDLVAYDPENDAEFALQVEGRSVRGLGPYFEAHDLDVNDELTIRPMEDGRYAFTALRRPRRPDHARPDFVARLIDRVVAAGVPVSEAEIRALHPDLPAEFALRAALERDGRLVLAEGRWRPAPPGRPAPVARERGARGAAADETRAAEPPAATGQAPAASPSPATAQGPAVPPTGAAPDAAARELPSVEAAAERRMRARAAQEAAAARAEVEAALEAQEAREAELLALVQQEDYERHLAASGAIGAGEAAAEGGDDERRRSRERLARRAEDDVRQEARDRRRRAEDADPSGDETTFAWDAPTPRGFRLPWLRRAPAKTAGTPAEPVTQDPFQLDRLGEPRPVDRNAPPSRVTPTPRAGLFASEPGVAQAKLPPGDPEKTKRARESFARLGYRVEGLAHGQLMLHADLGRRQERVLVHVLPDGQRLDWAALLARRRESGAAQLAVVGDHRDLHRLVSPAELAKATLWSWAGLDRAVALADDLPIGPFDLEPHFERDGLFEYGLERFERTIARRVQERGVFSSVLERLASLKAPSVFVLDDVVGSGEVPRDQALRVLERLGDAPFHLVSRVDSGEFCLRYRVHDALDGLVTYATSLRARLPDRQRARVAGIADGVEPLAAEELEGAAAAAAPATVEHRDPAPEAEREPVPVRAVRRASEAQRLPFAGPGLGEDVEDEDAVDVAQFASEPRRPR